MPKPTISVPGPTIDALARLTEAAQSDRHAPYVAVLRTDLSAVLSLLYGTHARVVLMRLAG